MKEKYLKIVNERFEGRAKEILIKQIDLFYADNVENNKNKYNIGDDVKLKKDTYMHGIPNLLDNFDWIVENGFIGNGFTNQNTNNKIKNSIGMWAIKEECLLKDYIINYSGITIGYSIARGEETQINYQLVPYHKFDEVTEKINNDKDIWTYWGEQTKEVRFMPSLVSNKRQIAFILNMESDIAKKMIKSDIWSTELDEKILEPFIDYRYYSKFLEERYNRNSMTTDRETAIMFGLPANLIEGVLVGRILENDSSALKHIKDKLPNCYICNLDGKVIVGND